jgi:uncharacterized protein
MLLDTSGLLCLLHHDESEHEQAKILYNTAFRRLTHSYVLAELIPLCQARGLPRKGTLEFARSLLTSKNVEVVWVSELLHRQALQLLENRQDKIYSLCDAVSFVLMRERQLLDALTTDKHFEQEGFTRLLV